MFENKSYHKRFCQKDHLALKVTTVSHTHDKNFFKDICLSNIALTQPSSLHPLAKDNCFRTTHATLPILPLKTPSSFASLNTSIIYYDTLNLMTMFAPD
jgi:hypothetical protein